MSDLISVQYQSKTGPGKYGGREYTYRCALAGAAVGDLVMAPVKDGFSIARVSAVDIPESGVDERIMPMLKTIEKRWKPEQAPIEAKWEWL